MSVRFIGWLRENPDFTWTAVCVEESRERAKEEAIAWREDLGWVNAELIVLEQGVRPDELTVPAIKQVTP